MFQMVRSASKAPWEAEGQLKNDPEACTNVQFDLQKNIAAMCEVNPKARQPHIGDGKGNLIFKCVFCHPCMVVLPVLKPNWPRVGYIGRVGIFGKWRGAV